MAGRRSPEGMTVVHGAAGLERVPGPRDVERGGERGHACCRCGSWGAAAPLSVAVASPGSFAIESEIGVRIGGVGRAVRLRGSGPTTVVVPGMLP